jgi:hypothetical protein
MKGDLHRVLPADIIIPVLHIFFAACHWAGRVLMNIGLSDLVPSGGMIVRHSRASRWVQSTPNEHGP